MKGVLQRHHGGNHIEVVAAAFHDGQRRGRGLDALFRLALHRILAADDAFHVGLRAFETQAFADRIADVGQPGLLFVAQVQDALATLEVIGERFL